MSRWFRMYDELLDDPKVQRLGAEDFKAWVNLLCLASRNDGRLPRLIDISFALRLPEATVSTVLERLLDGGLIERRSGGADGAHYAPHKWGERQYKSDTSTERVKRYRERSKTAAETPSEAETEAERPLDKSNGGEPLQDDPVKQLFDVGVSVLAGAGVEAKQARSLIGKWRKEHRNDGKVLTALLECRAKAVSEPVEWLQKRLAKAGYISPSGYEYRGDAQAIMREAEKRADWTTFYAVKGAAN